MRSLCESVCVCVFVCVCVCVCVCLSVGCRGTGLWAGTSCWICILNESRMQMVGLNQTRILIGVKKQEVQSL